jgi:prepilin-type N-terminal cleavage/methylation domain-containing protein
MEKQFQASTSPVFAAPVRDQDKIMQTSQAMECKTTSRMIGDTRRAHSAQRGFTLIELIIGVVIVSLLLALGIPSFKSWVLNAQIRDGAEAILNGIQLARANAIQQNRLVVFELQNTATPANWRIISTAIPRVLISSSGPRTKAPRTR